MTKEMPRQQIKSC